MEYPEIQAMNTELKTWRFIFLFLANGYIKIAKHLLKQEQISRRNIRITGDCSNNCMYTVLIGQVRQLIHIVVNWVRFN